MWQFVNLCLGVFKWHHFDDYTVKGQKDVREAEGVEREQNGRKSKRGIKCGIRVSVEEELA